MVSYSFQGNKRLWNARDEEENQTIFRPQTRPINASIPSNNNVNGHDHETDKWPVYQIINLLRFYAAHPCLWNVECEDNHNRKMRHAALIDITAAMGGDLTKNQVVQKINVIRATYRYEKKRIKQRMRRGLGARTKLKWFAVADAFLRGVPKKGYKKEDPNNSDSDLDDAVVFTINPETLGPLQPNVPLEEETSPEKSMENTEILLEPKIETISDDSQFIADAERENKNSNNSSSSDDSLILATLKKPKLEDIEDDLQEQLKIFNQTMKSIKQDRESLDNWKRHVEVAEEKKSPFLEIYKPLSVPWTLDTTLQFIQILKKYPILCESSVDLIKTSSINLALQSIAQEMEKPFKSIERRWAILRETYEKEKGKILENPQYEPPYMWWHEAEKLMESQPQMKTESIYLKENSERQSSSTEDDDGYENLFQNPIPSVAPLSNMNEAMASLFHEDFSLGSNTNASFPLLENESSSQSCKIIWNGLEDDLLEGKWSLKHSVKFLRLYGVHRCLWDLNDPDYRSRPLRNAAIEDIAASMGHGLTAAYVAKKIKIFRITYMQQRKRILEATERGETPDILLKWFPLADSFLRPHIGLRSIKSDAKEMPQFDFQYVYANLNLIDPALLTDFRGKGTQNAIDIGNDNESSFINSDAEE